jgi:gliding motility-associated-like protein
MSNLGIMKMWLPGLAVFFVFPCFAQCPFTVNLTGSGTCPGATLTAGTLNVPDKIVWYENGTPVSTANAVSSFNPNGVTVAGIGGGGSAANQLFFPQGIFVDAAGDIYVSDGDNWRIEEYTPGATAGVTVAGGNGLGPALNQLNGAAGIFVDAAGNMYISDYGNFRVLKWAPGAASGVVVAGGNGSGSAANQFDFPVGIYVDATGNIYVADIFNERVQKWAPGASTGVTVAGGNGMGSGANQFMYPTDVFVDAAGDIYVVDDGNNRVQKWVPGATSGVTVAGGNGVGAGANQLNSPYGLYIDGNGDVFVGDAVNDRVQEWTPGATTGITVAGGNGPGVAANQMTDPRFVWLDANGNLYVSEDEDNRVQEFAIQPTINNTYIAPAPGTYTAVVTNAAGCTSTSNGIVIQGAVTPTISISASGNPVNSCTLVGFVAATTNAGITPSYQWQVNGINAGPNGPGFETGNLHNGDVVSCVLTAGGGCGVAGPVTSNPVSMVVLGSPAVAMLGKNSSCPGDTLAISSPDSLGQIVWMNNSGVVSTVAALSVGTAVTVAGGNGGGNAANQLFEPEDAVVDAAGNVYVADLGNFRVQKWAPGATSGVNVAGGPGDEEITPVGIALDAAGNVYVVQSLNATIEKYVPGATQGVVVAGGNGIGSAANQLNDPVAVFVDGAGNVYVADLGNFRVQKWAPGAGSGVTVAGGNGGGTGVNQCYPQAIFVDNAGNVYVDDEGNNRIQKWAPGAGSGITVVSSSVTGSSPFRGIWVDNAGDIFVDDYTDNSVLEFPPGSTQGVTVAAGNGPGSAANQLIRPSSVFVDAKGDIYVADWGNNRVQEYVLHSTIDTIYKAVAAGTYTAAVTTSGGCVIDVGAIVVNPAVSPAVTVAASAPEVCSNAPVTCTATPANGGAAPVYQWQVNGVATGSNNPVFTSSMLTGTAQVSCVMTGNASCSVPASATSNTVVVQVDPLVTPAVSISASATSICQGAAVSFAATPVNGGADPSYQWTVNGIDAGANNSVFTSSSLADGDVVAVILSGNALCVTAATAQSNPIPVHVSSTVAPTVNIVVSADPVCSGVEVTFSAVTNSLVSEHYQWQVNGLDVGVDSSGYSTAGLASGDVVVCKVTSADVCAAAESGPIAMTVNPTPVIAPDQVFEDESGGVVLQPKVSGDIVSYSWMPATDLSADNIADPLATPAASLVYTLTVVSAAGCVASGPIAVKVFSDIRIPNAFTPNGDGHNDVFYVMGGLPGSLIKDFSIFDRWGQRVFRVQGVASGDPGYGWDGRCNGTAAPQGIYVYIVAMSLAGGSEKVYRGTVVLVR